jgi:hypothetical protein
LIVAVAARGAVSTGDERGGGGGGSAGDGGGPMMIAGIAGRERGVAGTDAGAAPTSIVRDTVTAGGAAGGAGAGGWAIGAGLGGAGGGATGAATGGCGRACACCVGARCGTGAPGRAFGAGCGSVRAGTPPLPSPPPARPSLPGVGLRPSFGARFIGGPSSPALDGAVDDEDSASPFGLGKSFEKMLIAELKDRRIYRVGIKGPGMSRVRSRLHCTASVQHVRPVTPAGRASRSSAFSRPVARRWIGDIHVMRRRTVVTEPRG